MIDLIITQNNLSNLNAEAWSSASSLARPTYDTTDNWVTGNKIIFLGDHEPYGFHAQGQAEPSPLSARKRCTRNTLMAPDGGQRFAVDSTLL